MVHDGVLKLKKCACIKNVSNALTKSLPSPAFLKHREYLFGSRVPFEAFYAKIHKLSPTPARKAWLNLQHARALAASAA